MIFCENNGGLMQQYDKTSGLSLLFTPVTLTIFYELYLCGCMANLYVWTFFPFE